MDDKRVFEGFWYVDASTPRKDLEKMFLDKVGDGNNVAIAFAYDAYDLIVKSYEEFYKKTGRIATADELAEEVLRVKNYNSAVGEISVNSEGIIESEAVIKIIKNGKPVLLEK